MKKLRLVLLPFAMIIELLLVVVVLGCVVFNRDEWGSTIVNWARTRLPSYNWYIGKE